LIAVAARELEVLLDTADHEQLLEQLRRLRQRVPGARGEPRRHQEVASALRGGTGQSRGLDLEKALVQKGVASGTIDVRAQAQRLGRSLAPKVEIAVAQPRLLA